MTEQAPIAPAVTTQTHGPNAFDKAAIAAAEVEGPTLAQDNSSAPKEEGTKVEPATKSKDHARMMRETKARKERQEFEEAKLAKRERDEFLALAVKDPRAALARIPGFDLQKIAREELQQSYGIEAPKSTPEDEVKAIRAQVEEERSARLRLEGEIQRRDLQQFQFKLQDTVSEHVASNPERFKSTASQGKHGQQEVYKALMQFIRDNGPATDDDGVKQYIDLACEAVEQEFAEHDEREWARLSAFKSLGQKALPAAKPLAKGPEVERAGKFAVDAQTLAERPWLARRQMRNNGIRPAPPQANQPDRVKLR